jgi:hypothetical protein
VPLVPATTTDPASVPATTTDPTTSVTPVVGTLGSIGGL